jgi:hypothetical protein
MLRGAIFCNTHALGVRAVETARSSEKEEIGCWIVVIPLCCWFLWDALLLPNLLVYRWMERGVETEATVLSCTFVRGKTGKHSTPDTWKYELEYDGYRHFISTPRFYESGQTLPVLYLPDSPQDVVVGRSGDSAWALIRSAYGYRTAPVFRVVFTVIFLGVPTGWILWLAIVWLTERLRSLVRAGPRPPG